MPDLTSEARPQRWSCDTLKIGPVTVCDLPSRDARQHLHQVLDQGQQVAIGFCNANLMLKAHTAPHYASALNALILLNDGIGMDLCSTLFRGRGFRDNLNGTDFIPAFLDGEQRGRTLFLLGARPGVAEAAADNLERRFPQHRVVGTRDGYFAPEETDAVIAQINAAAPDILLVALGNPDQEIFIARNAHRIDARVLMGVGALLDYTAGASVRAPAAMRQLRLEWLFRLLREPRRLGRRYTVELMLFLGVIVRLRLEALVHARRTAAPSAS